MVWPMLLGAGTAAAQEPSEAAVGFSLERVAIDREVLAIRGSSLESEPPQFSSAATLFRIPCPGAYRYESHIEDQQTGALSSYAARVSLAPLASDHSQPCGGALPPGQGVLRISIWGELETIDFRSEKTRRDGSGAFFGVFTLGPQPQCGQAYTVSVNVEVGDWHRTVRYRLWVDRWSSTAQGLPLLSEDC